MVPCALLCVLMLVGCGSSRFGSLTPERAQTATELEAKGAKVEVTGDAITAIDFYNCDNIADTIPLLDELPTIERLNFSSLPVTDEMLAHLKGLNNLKQISLTETPVEGEGLVHLAGLNRLEVLSLNGSKITDASLVHLSGLPSLRVLGLYRTAITDEGLSHLEGLKGLQSLQLSGPGVTAEGIENLKQSLPEVDITYRADPTAHHSQYER